MEIVKDYLFTNVAFWVCLGISAALLVAGFLVPPMGIVDGSVLTGVGELAGFATLAVAAHAIDTGLNAKVTHGNTTIEVHRDDE